jgi:rifampicin phosphotransferase
MAQPFHSYRVDLRPTSIRTVAAAMTDVGLRPTPLEPEHLPPVVDLDDVLARDPVVTGAKAAALARARAHGLSVLPGFALTTAAARALEAGAASREHAVALHTAWQGLSDDGRRPLVVRSSSTVEDSESQSMAGMFTSILDVHGWEAFIAAVDQVAQSGGEAPIAVLVQPFLQPAWGGVLFGADPVTGRTDRLVVAAVPGGPDRLVSGQVDGIQFTLSSRGRLRDGGKNLPQPLHARRARRRLVRLARRAAATFAGPQDIEWAMEDTGRLVLLQSRPITAIGDEARAGGPILGPGPVAETFGLPLRSLEEDLWVPPLRDGIREALTFTGATPARKLRRSPVVVTVGGRVAADLELLGLTGGRRSLWSRLDPRPPARRLKAAWRVGRLKVALPALADDLIGDIDADLSSVPAVETLSPTELVRLLRRSRQTLTALHGHEVLAGQLLDDGDTPTTAASAALRLLVEMRNDGTVVDDADLVARHPLLLSLLPPTIGGEMRLPPPPASLPTTPSHAGGEAAVGASGASEYRKSSSVRASEHRDSSSVRESLRLRARWVHELTALAALALGRVLVDRGVLASATDVANLRLDELVSLVESGGSLVRNDRASHLRSASALVLDLRRPAEPGPPLPASFRLSADEVVVPVATGRDDDGRGAGGGRRVGRVHVGTDDPPVPGDVLVVRTLDPALASLLPGLGGLVAETGSVLSHLAILAREYGVPTVVSFPGAVDRLAPGSWVVVDGTTGEVSALEAGEWGAA